MLDDVEDEGADDGMDERIAEDCSDEEDEVGLAIHTCRCDL